MHPIRAPCLCDAVCDELLLSANFAFDTTLPPEKVCVLECVRVRVCV